MIRLRSIASVFLSALLVLSTIGISLNKHHCMGRVMSISIIDKAPSCMGDMDCLPGCCHDTKEILKVDDLTNPIVVIDIAPEFLSLYAINLPIVELIKRVQVKGIGFNEYTPPEPDRDIPVEVRSFLI